MQSTRILSVALTFLLTMFWGLPLRADETPAVPADLILTNGKVYTVDKRRSWAEAVAIRQGRIVVVGTDKQVLPFVGKGTRVVDLKGGMVLPSFQDVHIHPVAGGVAYSGCSLFDLESYEQVLQQVAQCARDNPDAAQVRGYGWNWGLFVGHEKPHKSTLDAIDDRRPIVLGDSDGHTLWVNSPALELAGITASTPDPEGGEISREDDSRLPSGLLLEGPAMDMLTSKLPPLTAAERENGLLYAQGYLHSLGITAIQDAIVRLKGSEPDRSLEAYRALLDKGELDLRVVAALYWEPGAGMEQIDALIAARRAFSGERLQATAIKFWADGIIESHTAMLLEPYTDQPDNHGLLMVPREEMMAAVPQLDAAGFQLHIHAIGDATVRYALDAFEQAQSVNGKRDSRHLTAHTQLVHPQDIKRFGQLGVIAGFSPYWAYADSYVADINPPQLGPQRMQRMYPIRSIADTGGRIAFGSDWSVSTADPLLGIETAVTRINPELPPTPVFIPEQRITLDQAIAAYTIDAAYANFLDRETGSIEAGKYADLILLSANLFEVPASGISDITVLATLMEGKLVYGQLERLAAKD